jgi:hypothetical protein
MNRSQKLMATLTALTFVVGGPAFAGAKPAKHKKPVKPAKHAKPAPKFKAETFMCQHGCKKMITVKAAADLKKTCPVCMCKAKVSACKPAKSTKKA